MSFEQVLDEAVELLRRRRRLTHAAIRRQFALDEATVADVVQELIRGRQVARDEGGDVVVWHEPDAPATTAMPASTARSEAERRQITVLFCDLVDSTALANALDPEEWRTVLRAFQGTAKAVIETHGGFVNSYLGDGIVVFFGYPKAAEDDAVRAVRAALELVAAVEALRPLADIRLRMRAGLATGVVVVGDVIGEGASREEAVVGSTPNLAARLQSMAGPSEVLVGPLTRRLTARRFKCADMGPHPLKGFDAPIAVSRVLAERSHEEDFADLAAGIARSPLVDRVVELPALRQHWHAASGGRGRVITLRGEAGLGKSRLIEALRETLDGERQGMLRYYCSTRFQNTAFYPVIRHLHHAAGFTEDDGDATRLAKLEAFVRRTTPEEPTAAPDAHETDGAIPPSLPYLAALLSIPPGERFVALADSPERLRELTLDMLEAHVLQLARSAPMLMVVEDLHWVDPSTLGLLDRLVRKIADLPVMVLATGRPEFEPPWADLPHAELLELSLLGREDRSTLVRQQVHGKKVPDEVVELILQKSDGNPLYVEELTKATLESGMLTEQADRFVLNGPLRTLAVPDTLHDSLLARLDHLAVVKDVVQAGATIGREFSYDMLAAVAALPPEVLRDRLALLVEAGLIHRDAAQAEEVFVFKHALIQDAAYATMLRPRRQSLHARIAEIMEADASAAARSPELVAHHLVEAGLEARAIPHLQQAGLLASATASHKEACKHFSEGLRLLAKLPGEANIERLGLELGLRVHLGMSLAATRGFAAPEVEATHQRARDLCRLIGHTDELYWVLRGLCALYIVRSDVRASRELSDHLVRLGEQTRRPEFLIEGYLMQGYTLGYAGEAQAARAALVRAIETYQSAGGSRMVFPTPQDPSVAALSQLAIVCWMLGEARLAARHAADAIRDAEISKRPFDLAYAHSFAAMFEIMRRDSDRAAHHAAIAIDIGTRHGFGVWQAAGAMHLGIAKVALGAPQEAVGLLGATLPAWRASGAELNSSFFMAGLAAGQQACGEVEQALATLSQAIAHAEDHDEHFYIAELFRMRAELRVARGLDGAHADDAADRDFRRAIDVARQQGAIQFELRATVGHARWLHARGETDLAHALLAAAIGKMDDTEDTADAREAASLLLSLRDPHAAQALPS